MEDVPGPPVWARRRVALPCCPKSYLTAESLGLTEEFAARRRMGGMNFRELSARQVDAFLVLEAELTEELRRGRENYTRDPA